MWHVDNQTPFGAHGYFVRDRDGAEYWVVAVRAKFRVLNNGRTELHETQAPPNLAPRYADPHNLELVEESDFVPFRPGADILLQGFVFATDPNPNALHPFGFRVGSLQKVGEARPRRRIRKKSKTWELIHQDPFEPVPLSWTESLGGLDPVIDPYSPARHPSNPIGRGWLANLTTAPDGVELEMPRIENIYDFYDPGRPLPQPFGFGPLQPSWQPRLGFAGTYDDVWRKTRSPLLPADFSDSFYQAAPADQIYPDDLKGGEPVFIEGMHPEGPYEFSLPRFHLRASTKLANRRVTQRFRIVSVHIDGTEKTVDLVWNSHLLCTGREHQLEESRLILLRQLRPSAL